MVEEPRQLGFDFSAAQPAVTASDNRQLVEVDTRNASSVGLFLMQLQKIDIEAVDVSFDGNTPLPLSSIIVDLNDAENLRRFVTGLELSRVSQEPVALDLHAPHIFITNRINSSVSVERLTKEGLAFDKNIECRPAHYDSNVGTGLALSVKGAYVTDRARRDNNAHAVLVHPDTKLKLRDFDRATQHKVIELQVEAIQERTADTFKQTVNIPYSPTRAISFTKDLT